MVKNVRQCSQKPETTSPNVLFCPQPENIQFTVMEILLDNFWSTRSTNQRKPRASVTFEDEHVAQDGLYTRHVQVPVSSFNNLSNPDMNFIRSPKNDKNSTYNTVSTI